MDAVQTFQEIFLQGRSFLPYEHLTESVQRPALALTKKNAPENVLMD